MVCLSILFGLFLNTLIYIKQFDKNQTEYAMHCKSINWFLYDGNFGV